MPQTLGEKLRAAREERGISASEVAEQTRISPIYIEAIERNDYKPLPGGIFNKGFVKSYAKFIGLDEQEALSDYARIVADTEGTSEPDLRVYRPEVLTDDNAAPSMVPTIIFAGIILALMTGGVLFLVNYLQGQPAQPDVTGGNLNSNLNVSNKGSEQEKQPEFNEIRVEFRALSEKVNVRSIADGVEKTEDIEPSSSKIFTARDSLSISYYKGYSDRVELTLNGKKMAVPPAPPRGNTINIALDRSNLARIWESGTFAPPGETQTATQSPTPMATPTQLRSPEVSAETNINRSEAATPRPSPQRTPTPRPSPTRTPIVVGNAAPANRP